MSHLPASTPVCVCVYKCVCLCWCYRQRHRKRECVQVCVCVCTVAREGHKPSQHINRHSDGISGVKRRLAQCHHVTARTQDACPAVPPYLVHVLHITPRLCDGAFVGHSTELHGPQARHHLEISADDLPAAVRPRPLTRSAELQHARARPRPLALEPRDGAPVHCLGVAVRACACFVSV